MERDRDELDDDTILKAINLARAAGGSRALVRQDPSRRRLARAADIYSAEATALLTEWAARRVNAEPLP